MAVKDFKFISPGVFINEIDNSQLPATPEGVGPVIIGRAQRGPGLIPTQVNSFSEFVQIFGNPVSGRGGGDVARYGNTVGPTYGTYAAQAWLRNNSPVTYVRLVGQQHSEAVKSSTDSAAAGWQTLHNTPDIDNTQGGAWGLFVVQSGTTPPFTGTLAAVWYVNSGSVALSGTSISASSALASAICADADYQVLSGTCIMYRAAGAGTWKASVKDGSDNTVTINSGFNFDSTSEKFIRKVFNTNPILSNADVTTSGSGDGYANYWLGETYEDAVNLLLTGDAGDQYGVIYPLYSGSYSGGEFRKDKSDPKTGWFISQDLSSNTASFDAQNQQKLFRIVAKNTGRWASRNIKVSIQDIRVSADPANAYGSFTVAIRAMNDTDNRPRILEQFNNCNLNPSSENYVARKIGDKYLTWDDTDRRYTSIGDFNSKSDFIYVSMNTQVDEGKANPEYLPFGVFGPPRWRKFDIAEALRPPGQFVTGGYNFQALEPTVAGKRFTAGGCGLTSGSGGGSTSGRSSLQIGFEFPSLRLRASASEGTPSDPRAIWYGVDTTFNRSGRHSETIGDYTGPRPTGVDNHDTEGGLIDTEYSWVFTLDDLCNTDSLTSDKTALTGTNVYVSGSRQDVVGGGSRGALGYVNSGSYKNAIDMGADRFTTVLHGGFDGLDITEAEPFRNTLLVDGTSITNYAFNSLNVAMDAIRDPEAIEFDLAAMPGITNNILNRSLVDLCEDRGDALAVIDLKNGYVPETENTTAIASRLGSVRSTINNKKQSLQINSSFGCAYYPWVQIQDTINGALVWVPSSVAALGAMSYGQRTQELWFAPAGFTRGGLQANNAAGLPVVGVRERLVSKDRDKLYEANINPIAQFPAEGIVIFGQKTLQVTPSALDRINVRRLLIFVKRQISRIAATLLFDQNVQSTWNRFLGRAEPFLATVQAGLGLADYRIILDETTTTPDLIDRNIMYAKIFLKPARSIEFIAIDFVITDSGASFED